MTTPAADHAPAPALFARVLSRLHISHILPWLVLAAGLLATQHLREDARQDAMQELRVEFDSSVREAGMSIRQYMSIHAQVLRGVHGLFGASVNVERNEFRDYVSHLQLDESFAGLEGIGYSRIVWHAEKDRYVAAMRGAGYSAYTIEPQGIRDIYAPVDYMEPFAGSGLRVSGLDLYAVPEHRVAMEQARDSGSAIITGKVALERAAGGARNSVVMYMPTFRGGAPDSARVERRANITGWVFAVLNMPSLVHGVLGDHAINLDIEIHDGMQTSGAALLSASRSGKPDALFGKTFNLDVAGRRWTMLAHSRPEFDARLNNDRVQLITVFGIGASLLLALFAWVTGRNWAHAVHANLGLKWELAARKKLQATLRESEERWRFALEGGGEGVWDWNIRAGVTDYSKRWREILGFWGDETWEGQREWKQRIHPDDMPSAMAAMQAHFDGKTPFADCELRMLCKRGGWKWVSCRGMVVSRDANGDPTRLVGTIADITGRRAREDELRLAATVFNIADEAMLATDAENLIVAVNEAFTTITGYQPAEVIGRNPKLLASGLHPPEFYKAMWDALQRDGKWSGEICNRRKDWQTYTEWLSIKTVRDDKGGISHYVAAFSDISARKTEEERIKRAVNYDAPTGLPNRSLFEERLHQALAMARRDKEHLAVLLLGLDETDAANDALLQKVAARLQSCMQRGSDAVSRYGAEEFAVLLPHICGEKDAVMAAEKILSALAQPFTHGSHSSAISASIGIVIYQQHGETAQQLMENAVTAMRHTRKNRRNGYDFFSAGMAQCIVWQS